MTSVLKSLITSQSLKNGINSNRVNIKELLTLPVFTKSSAAISFGDINASLKIHNLITVSLNEYFITSTLNEIKLYRNIAGTNTPITTGNFKFGSTSNDLIKNKIYTASAGGVLTLLSIYDSTNNKLYINGYEETLNNGETFISDTNMYIYVNNALHSVSLTSV